MTSHRFRYFSIGLGLGATVGLLLATRPSGHLAGSDAIPADRPDARLAGGAADFEGGTAASTEDVPVPATSRSKNLEGVRDSGMLAYRDALGQRW